MSKVPKPIQLESLLIWVSNVGIGDNVKELASLCRERPVGGL